MTDDCPRDSALASFNGDLSVLVPAALDAVPTGMLIIDREFRIVHSNQYVLDWLKCSREDVLGRHCYKLIHGESAKCANCPSQQAFRTGEVAHLSHSAENAEGHVLHVEITAYPVKDAKGEVEYVIEHAKDISERVAHEVESAELLHALSESERRYRTMLEHSNDLIWTLDRDGNFLWFNRKAEEVSGYRPAEWRGRSFAPMIAEEDFERVQRAFTETLAGKAQSYEARARRKDGSELVLLVNTAPIFSNDEIIGTVSFGTDITERKQAEERTRELYETTDEELKRKVVELEGALAEAKRGRATVLAVERLRDDFLHMVSHDLRIPLNSAALNAQLIQRSAPADDDRLQRAVRAILQSTESMGAMITDLVESARLQSGQLELHQQPTSPAMLLADLVSGLAPADQQRVQLTCAVDLDWIAADRARLSRAVGNLVSNALKYSAPEQPVEVRVEATSRAVILTVSDHGPGIPAEDLPHLFERFYRSSAHRGFAGLGLGLHIARSVVEAHGGSISVVSRIGRGSSFTITLPSINGA